ncbi:MAG: hypothetical protein GWN01_17065 [Nitrosopumilaceae archaeon]|nr:hypothetical protein [Nitrosopumilaceae archaeon]NIU86910.1 hypothetical protein [Nitrosopumilaceae archaeon]NIV65588.1 hypothetical protein [Nitrosopumilaceae archaeon]NIX63143.1 hypothetical protein [Nitrosopumilaceae archaeon]
MKASDARFSKDNGELCLVEVVNGDSVYIGISSKFYTTKEEAERIGHKLGIQLTISSKRDFRFFVSEAFLIDKNSKKLMPHSHSIFRKDHY